MTKLFMRAELTSAYLKMGLLGFAGSGKTYTAADTGIGLVKHMQALNIDYAKRPVFFLDTETGSDWVAPKFKEAEVALHTAKTRAFSDLLEAVREGEKDASLLIVDSISHFWKELCDAYMKKKNRTRLEFQDWNFLKSEWAKFTDLFVNSSLHIILCGRAGYEYDYFEDDAGKKNLEKTGIKMKAESEMGYEPSLLVLMSREMDVQERKTWRTGTVLKDRSTLTDGKEFINPKFECFLPHIKMLNLGGRQLGVDTERNSEASIPRDERDYSRVQRKIVLDEIESLMVYHYPGTSANDKKVKLALLRKHFAASWTEIETVMPLEKLRNGYNTMHEELEAKPSKYAKPEIDDEIPEHPKADKIETGIQPVADAPAVSLGEALIGG